MDDVFWLNGMGVVCNHAEALLSDLDVGFLGKVRAGAGKAKGHLQSHPQQQEHLVLHHRKT